VPAASADAAASLEQRRQRVEARGDAIAAAYQPTPLDVDVMLFNAADRPRPAHYAYDESGGWREQVGDRVEVVMVPGDHDELLTTARTSGAIARALRSRLRIVQRFVAALAGALFAGDAPAGGAPTPSGEYRAASRTARPAGAAIATTWTQRLEASPPARRGDPGSSPRALAERRQRVEARSDAIAASYRARPLGVDVLLFNAADRPRPQHYAYDESGGWREMVGTRIEVVMVPGDHTDLLSAPDSAAQIADALRHHRARRSSA
jgi:thioesterase domain-containing protein